MLFCHVMFEMTIDLILNWSFLGNVRFKGADLWQYFMKLFNMLPVAATVADSKILCMHGGISPDLHTFDDIKKIKRPSDIPPKGLLTDLLWADPDKVCIYYLRVINVS